MTEKTKCKILPDARDACVRRLGDILMLKKGIQSAHLVNTTTEGVNQIYIHFHLARLSIGEVREPAIRTGAKLDWQFGYLFLNARRIYAR